MLVGGLFKGAVEHVAMKAGGNETCQLLVAEKGVVTSSGKYVIAHSAHTSINFLAATWDILKAYPEKASGDTSTAGQDSKSGAYYNQYDET